MGGFLASLYNRFTGALGNLWNGVIDLLRGYDGYVSGWLQYLLNYSNSILSDARHLSDAFYSFIWGSYWNFTRWVQQQIFQINVREHEDYTQIGNDIADLQRRTSQQITVVQQKESSDFSALIKWIIKTIFDPLFGDIARALGWIAKEGAYVLDLLTHADKLLAWLLHYLIGDWSALSRIFGRIFLSWYKGNWRSIAPVVATILEDIIASVLLGRRHVG